MVLSTFKCNFVQEIFSMNALKIDSTIKENLFSADETTVLAAIEKISKIGNKLYIPILFDLLKSEPEKAVEDAIKKLFATVKDKDTTETFISVFKDEKYKSIWKAVLTTCWQNGLDFSAYTVTFVELVINEDWEIAFEAFTIIDNMEFLPDQKIIEETRQIISTALENANEQKTYFLQEILTKIS